MLKKSLLITLMFGLFSCNLTADGQTKKDKKVAVNKVEGLELATFGNGCFWCTEAVFEELEGVSSVEAGYAGGFKDRPSYKEVSSGRSGHAEVIRFSFDPKVISYRELLEVFFYTHDPTTLNRQGADVGTQYRSAIFYHSEAQKKDAEEIIVQLEEENVYKDKIVTEITPISKYSTAEADHQDFYANNKNYGYCRVVIQPKLEKFIKKYKHKLKKN